MSSEERIKPEKREESEKDACQTTIEEDDVNNYASANTSEDEHHETDYIDQDISTSLPLSSLAGPALVDAPDLDGRTITEEFDWVGKEEHEDEIEKKEREEKYKKRSLTQKSAVMCLSDSSSWLVWLGIIFFGLVLVAVDVAIFVSFEQRVSMVSFNLELWFTWLAFMWGIAILSQLWVEVVPWLIRKVAGVYWPHATEVLRMRLAYYMALRTYIKLIIISAWAWGAWAFIEVHVPLPAGPSPDQPTANPSYVGVFYSIWECCFFASLLLFMEKFLLQLIITSFHKKAYGERIEENDAALKILDRLKRVKRKPPQEKFLKRIRRKNKGNSTLASVPNSRRHSQEDLTVDSLPHTPDAGHQQQTKSIMVPASDEVKTNVRFPSENIDTLIAIPPLEEHYDDEKTEGQETSDVKGQRARSDTHATSESVYTEYGSPPKRPGLFHRLGQLRRRHRSDSNEDSIDQGRNNDVSPPPLSRQSTEMTMGAREKSFLSSKRDFVLNTAAVVPGRLIKEGRRIMGGTHHNQAPQSTQIQAKVLARRIFQNLVGPGSTREAIYVNDFYPYFPTEKEADAAFALFDVDDNGDISRRELRSGCVRIYRERKNLARSMRDLSQATGKLDLILLVIFVAIWVIIVCAAFGVNVGTQLMPLWSAFIAASFIFGNSAKEAFDSIIFVFVTHCFDAGDRVMVGTENWVVREVGLLSTTFIKWDGTIVYAKNGVLATQYIINCRRAGPTGESVELHISFSTPSDNIVLLQEHMMDFTNTFPKLYTPNATSANIVQFENQNRITLSFYFEHTKNWQDPGGRWLRHNKFMMELKRACEKLDIAYSMPPQPIHYDGPNKPNDAPPEAYNQGNKSSYGLEGLRQRRAYEEESDQIRGAPGNTNAGQSGGQSSGGGNEAGAAATLMFASAM